MIYSILDLVKKYNVAVPRYTSYPPLPVWNEPFNEYQWIKGLKEEYKASNGIDLYVHIPYCESLCYYCGCNRTITKDRTVERIYVDSIKLEWDLYNKKILNDGNSKIKVSSIHLGGGTPTFLSPPIFEELLTYLTINKSDNFLGSIEVDPRTCKIEHLQILIKLGFKRISLGIQDFSPEVQVVINRIQNVELVQKIVNDIRTLGFESLNFDLIYGLPKQTLETINYTLEQVKILRPDVIAFYSYAHLPQKIPNQKLIKNSDLPSTELKYEIFSFAIEKLKKSEYEFLGMDHFSLPEGYLAKAQKNKSLQRNFMGYTDKKTNILLGLGLTSISDNGLQYAQNFKNMHEYQECLTKGILPITLVHSVTADEQLIKSIIQDLMCYKKVDITPLMESNLPAKYLLHVKTGLEILEDDNLLNLQNNILTVSENGAHFLRVIASIFDFNLFEQQKNNKFTFSQSV